MLLFSQFRYYKLRFNQVFFLAIIAIFLILSSCQNNDLEYSVETKLNPNKIAPLTAMLTIKTEKPCQGSIEVLGASPVKQAFETGLDSLEVPLVGLYPGRLNKVLLTLNFEGGQVTDTLKISTTALPDYFPIIEINKVDRSKMEPGMHLCDIHYAKQGTYDSRPMIFDDQGEVRWYLDLGSFGDILWPIQRLKNGSLLVGGKNQLYEFDMLGKVIKNYAIDKKYRIHHDIVELPNGDFLMAVRKDGYSILVDGKEIPSLNDFIIVFNPGSSKIIKEWDMAKHLDVSRNDLIHTTNSDWLHMNGLAFDPRDSSIIVSGKNQGLAKISWKDELIWIMAPKYHWGKSGRQGNGPDTRPYLLTAIDAQGKPYPKEVQEGFISPDDFDFPWGQHSPKILPNGNITIFDNGHMRNFKEETFYSRAVEYKVNEKDKTVQQIWQYGKERGNQFFSMLISDVDNLPQTKNKLVTAGYIAGFGKIVELQYPGNEEVFEATVNFKTLNGNKTFQWGQLDILYRSERFELKY